MWRRFWLKLQKWVRRILRLKLYWVRLRVFDKKTRVCIREDLIAVWAWSRDQAITKLRNQAYQDHANQNVDIVLTIAEHISYPLT